jgi:hypothetical protein
MNYNNNGSTYIGLFQINTVFELLLRCIGLAAVEMLLALRMITSNARLSCTAKLGISGPRGRLESHVAADL